MTHMKRTRLLTLLRGDEELLLHLFEHGILTPKEDFPAEEVELALVARTLVRELEVNWAGVEIILRMRTELKATHAQVTHLVRWAREWRSVGKPNQSTDRAPREK